MKTVLIIAALLVAPAYATSDDDARREHCEQARKRLDAEGLAIVMKIEAIELFDSAQRTAHQLDFKLRPNVFGRAASRGLALLVGCGKSVGKDDPSLSSWSFVIQGHDVQIERGGRRLTGALLDPVTVVTSESTGDGAWQPTMRFQNGGAASKVMVHHAVGAQLMKDLGFDTWESTGLGSYTALMDLGTVRVFPGDSGGVGGAGGDVLGVASKGGKLYQVMVRNFSVSFGS